MAAIQVHRPFYVLRHHSNEVFRGGILIKICLHIVLHHRAEVLISSLVVPHQHADHLYKIGALGINQAPVCTSGFRRIQTQAQPDRPGVVRRNSEITLRRNLGFEAVPEFLHFRRFMGLLQKQSCGEFGEPFRKPLVVIACPAHHVPPPLVRDLMRSHFVDESCEPERIAAHHFPSLRFIEKRAHRKINERGPRLTEVERRLLRQRQTPEGSVSEDLLIQTHRILRVDQGVLRHRRRRQAHVLLKAPEEIRDVLRRIDFQVVLCQVVGHALLLELAVIETGDRDRHL